MPRRGILTICTLILGLLTAAIALHAQNMAQAKPPVYLYVSEWVMPRAQWPAMEKVQESQRTVLEKLLADGTIIGFGLYTNMIHTQNGPTHGAWMIASSQADILKALEQMSSNPDTTGPVLSAASGHYDTFLVSRIYGLPPGKHEGAYLSGSLWTVKPGQGHAFHAVLTTRIVPVLEKMLKDGTLVAYTVDTQAYTTMQPGQIEFVLITPDAAGLDKIEAAFEDNFKDDPEIGPAMRTLIKGKTVRDFLVRVSYMDAK